MIIGQLMVLVPSLHSYGPNLMWVYCYTKKTGKQAFIEAADVSLLVLLMLHNMLHILNCYMEMVLK